MLKNINIQLFAAGDPITVTNSVITTLDTITALTANAADADTDGLEQKFVITPTKPAAKGVIMIQSTGAAADGNISVSIAAGDFWASKAITGTVTKNTTKLIEVETAKVMQSDGTIEVTLDPAATDKLLTDHAAVVYYIELN